MPLKSGEIFAGFRIIRLLGSGGMGEVHLAQHPRLPRRDALKVLPADVSADAEYRARFNREADIASTLWHPHIVGVHDRGESEGHLWISMDFVDGQDAARLLADRYPGGMPVEQVVRIVTAVASALDYAHKQGLLHRDVKPANIMLSRHDEDHEQRVLLADFGIARNVDDISGLTTTNMTVGTVAYCAPEQLMGEEVDGRADLYALAATAYHLLTGAQLFPHSNPAVVISRHLNSAPPPLADTRADLAKLDPVLMKAIAKNPADRYARCADFARALAGEPGTWSARVSPTAATRPAPISRPAAPSARTLPAKPNVTPHSPSWLIPAVVAAVLILIAALILVWRPWSSRDASTSTQAGPAPVPTAAQTTTTTVPIPLPAPQLPRSEAPTTSAPTTVPTHTTNVTPGATLGLECADHHKIVYDPTTGQEITCFEVFSPSYGWFWQALSSTAGVHIKGTSCEGQRAWSSSKTPDGYMITCQPADIVSANPIAGPGSLWSRPENI